MLWTLAMTGEEPATSQTFLWKSVTFVYTELYLLLRVHQCAQIRFNDISYTVILIDEMIAGIKVTVMLYDGITSASLSKGTQTGLYATPAGQSGIKLVHEDLAHIITDPIVEYITEELSETGCTD